MFGDVFGAFAVAGIADHLCRHFLWLVTGRTRLFPQRDHLVDKWRQNVT